MDVDQRRHARFLRDSSQVLQAPFGKFGVEVGHGLIGEEHPWFLGECARNRYALLFAARERVRSLGRFVEHVHPLQGFQRLGPILASEVESQRPPCRHVAKAPGQYVLQGREPAHKVELLVDEPDSPLEPPPLP